VNNINENEANIFTQLNFFFNFLYDLLQKIVPPDWKHGIFKGRHSPWAVHKGTSLIDIL
jgi:hypothetical protein